MKPTSYIKTIKSLRKQIDSNLKKVRAIQDNKCKHPSPKKVHIYDRDGYLKNMNWTRFWCPLCDKSWTENGIV